MTRRHLRLLAASFALASLAACSKPPAPSAPARAHHEHHAPHGGVLVELGEHAYNLELALDPATGRLSAYVLDAHAENFVRIAAPSFQIVATVSGTPRPLLFRAVANSATGESVGDTSQFETQADWLKTTATFDATLASLEIRGTAFTQVAFNFPRGNDTD